MKTHSYNKRRNASVIFLSPDFNEAINVARSDLSLPAEGLGTTEETNDWYKRHHAKNTKEQLRPMPRWYWHFPKEFVELIDSFAYSSKPSKVNYYPDVPLDRRAMEIVKQFDLPEEMVDRIKGYILGGVKWHLVGPAPELKARREQENAGGRKVSLSVPPALQPILIPINEGDEGRKYMVLVAGLDESTTQKDWLEVWKQLEIVLRLSDMGKTPHKRPIDSLLLRDLSFWKQIKEGKTARQVATDWTDRHPEDKALGEDTVRKAADRVDKIMRPKS